MRLAICVGHRRVVEGAVSVGGVSEWAWAHPVALSLCAALRARGIDADVWTRDQHGGLSAMVGAMNRRWIDYAIDIHFNGVADPDANGFEVLHYPDSVGGQRLAEALVAGMYGHPQALTMRRRPTGGRWPTRVNGRGEELTMLTETKAWACIVEVGFGSNPLNWARMSDPAWVAQWVEKVADSVKALDD